MTPVEEQLPADTADGDGALDLARYARVVLKRKWLILAIVAVGVTATVLYTLQKTEVYQARASVIINPQAPQVFGHEVQDVVQLGTGSSWGNDEYYNTQVDIVTGHDLAEKAVERYDLQNNTALVPAAAKMSEKQRIALATNILWRSVSASIRRKSRILDIYVRSPDPKLAADLANKLADTYIAGNLNYRSKSTGEASKILSTQLDLADKRLRASENKLFAFKKEHGIVSASLEDKLNQIAADLQRYNGALNDARVKRIELETLKRRVEASKGVDVLESPIFALVGNTSVQDLKTQYETENQALLKLGQQLGPRHPELLAQRKVVDGLHEALEREAVLAANEVDQRLQKAIDTEEQFRTEVARLTKEAIDLSPLTRDFNDLKRQADADATNYDMVMGRLKTSELSGQNELNNIVWHERARPSAVPVYPRWKLNIAAATVLSLLLAIGVVLLLEYMDRTIKAAEEVEQTVHRPVLGLIPQLKDVPEGASVNLMRDRDLYVFKNPASQAAECCRAIRTNILFSGADRALRVLTITSPNPREGKTTSAIYLGTTMAQSGQRVLLVNTDMRRPRLHQSMGVSRDRGLSNLLLGETSLEEAVKSTDVPNLFVLPCGPMPPNPAELLLTQRFQQVLAELGERYDRIVLDSPPLQAVADAAVLGRLSDGVILVAKSRQTRRDDLARCVQQLVKVHAPVVGVVINSLDFSNRSSGYYRYGYKYTYSEAQADA